MSIYQIVVITEKELDEMAVAKSNENGVPKYACITKSGTVRFWPKFEPDKCALLARPGL
jgi:hypothetical protein